MFPHSRDGVVWTRQFKIPTTRRADCEKKIGAEVTADGQDPRSTARRAVRAQDGEEGHLPGNTAIAFMGDTQGGAFYADDLRAQRIAAAAKRLNELREAWLNHRTWW